MLFIIGLAAGIGAHRFCVSGHLDWAMWLIGGVTFLLLTDLAFSFAKIYRLSRRI